MVDLDTWGRRGGVVACEGDDIADVVDSALAHPEAHSAARRDMVQDLFYNPGRATDAALAWFDEQFENSMGADRRLSASR